MIRKVLASSSMRWVACEVVNNWRKKMSFLDLLRITGLVIITLLIFGTIFGLIDWSDR